ncbi:hypothetical protein [Xylanimonas ulmi]|uniref:Uncharacterized protein n=1 Tax=Xylanimonas ulmi TaxID=228973 RepID=A0A4Q7M7P4_9MICO|nr:hypothetical protein [Xylanibacterium ulmi]RZS62682.1 hypothetical protein EV386_3029 [Xylanibacterium ulmi]
MAEPTQLVLTVANAVGVPIAATADVLVRRGAEWSHNHPGLSLPSTIPLPAGFIQVTIDATAADHGEERLTLTYFADQGRWEASNPSCTIDTQDSLVNVTVPLGRIRFAPVVMLSDDLRVPATASAVQPFQPGAVLVTQQGYRTINLDVEERVRVLSAKAIGDPNSPGWDRFRWNEQRVKLSDRGNWLVLEYGDMTGQLGALRHVVGVWAPHTYTGDAPPVVVQITPNTRLPYYPSDRLPYTGAYPYGCVAAPGAAVDKATSTVALRDCRQAYVELPANRSLGQYKVVYQLYAARPDIFDGPHGPIVITPSPPLIAGVGPLRSPFDHPEGLGRLVAEVLRFLVAHKLTLPNAVGGLSVRFKGSTAYLSGTRPASPAIGVPTKTLTTLLCHSAGVVPVMSLANNLANRATFPRGFPRALWGGKNDYCDANWTNLWVVDGVASPGGIGVPSAGSPAARTWKTWLGRRGRRAVLVYTPSGLGGPIAPELISGITAPPAGKAGNIEEGASQNVRWLRMSYTYLRADPSQNPADLRPAFGGLSDTAEQSHNKIYEFGVGYAARP